MDKPTRMHRRSWLAAAASSGVGLFGLDSIQAGGANPELISGELVTVRARNAIRRGLNFLADRQDDSGSFGTSGYGRNVGVCGLAGMAFMASGSTPGRGTYGENVSACLRFVLENVEENGLIVSSDGASHGPMYGHGFATLFLAEVYGMSPRTHLRQRLSDAVQLIVETQSDDGGWRYHPESLDADLSVTICQVMALRAARNAGIFVPSETMQRCISYVKRSQNSDGGFMYLLSGGPSAFPRSAAGIVALFSAGVHQGKEIDLGLDYLQQFVPSDVRHDESHFFYAHYYAVQAMWHAGGQRWQAWYPAIRELLVRRQDERGSWASPISAEYGTAMATIILQMPNNYLPIFQR